MTVLVVRPTRDSPENGGTAGPLAYGQYWLQHVVWSLRVRDLPTVDLRNHDAVRPTFEEAVRNENPSVVVGAGHGLSTLYSGQFLGPGYSLLLARPGTPEEKPDLHIDLDNAGIMRGRVVYLLSCLAGKSLGPYIVERGGRAFAGFSEEFVWTVSSPRLPGVDDLARSFGRLATAFPKALASGRTVGEAEEEFRRTADAEVRRWEESGHPFAREVVKWLLWDKDAFTVIGDKSARPVPRRPRTLLWRIGALAGLAGAVARWGTWVM